MQDQIKTLRVQCDGLAQLTKELKPVSPIYYVDLFTNSKEIDKAVDSLYLAKAWLGKLLGELGTANPYSSGYKTKEDIVPTQDVASERLSGIGFETENDKYLKLNHIEKVDWLRTEIQKLIPELEWGQEYPSYEEWKKDEKKILAVRESQKHLSEARFWLGFECERIKNEG